MSFGRSVPRGPLGSRIRPDTPEVSSWYSPVVSVVLALANDSLERPHSEKEIAAIVAHFEAERVTHVSREGHFRVCFLTRPNNVLPTPNTQHIGMGARVSRARGLGLLGCVHWLACSCGARAWGYARSRWSVGGEVPVWRFTNRPGWAWRFESEITSLARFP